MNLKIFELFTGVGYQDDSNAHNDDKKCMDSYIHFQERLRKTLYYGKYADGTLPSPIVTDVAVRLINSKTACKKALEKHQAARMTRRARISPCALMMGILYTERLAQSNPNYLKKVSSSDLFMVSMLVASKYLYDDGEEDDAYNYDWCKAGNYHIQDLNRLEREFLSSIEWKIFISYREFFDLVNRVEARVALDLGKGRGWYSYLDMSTLFENKVFQELLTEYLKNTGKIILGCTLAYLLSVALLLSTSTFFARKSTSQQEVPVMDAKSIPSTFFMGQLGNPEYSLKILNSVKKRQTQLRKVVMNMEDDSPIMKLNHTTGAASDMNSQDTYDNCRLSMITWARKSNFSVDWLSRYIPECISSMSCNVLLNDTFTVELMMNRLR